MNTKVCSKCKIEKHHSEYFKDSRRVIGIRCKCKKCCKAETIEWRERNKSHYNNYISMWRAKNPDKQHATEIKRNYGLSAELYKSMLESQKNGCDICGKAHDPSVKKGKLFVDHCHHTGKIRALLCINCNSAIGHFNDNTDLVEKALAYLKKHA